MCEKCGLVYKKLCPICDPKQIRKIEDKNLEKENQLKENFLSARSKLFDITGNSGKVLNALIKFEEASNNLYRHRFEKN